MLQAQLLWEQKRQHGPSAELEARLGILGARGFVGGVTSVHFQTLLKSLSTNPRIRKNCMNVVLEDTFHKSSKEGGGEEVRMRKSESAVEAVCKRRLAWADCAILQRDHDVRLSLKSETPTAIPLTPADPQRTRRQVRHSFWTLDGFCIELSEVDTGKQTTFEVEIEVEDVSKSHPANFLEWIACLAGESPSSKGSYLFVRTDDSKNDKEVRGIATNALIVSTVRDGVCK